MIIDRAHGLTLFFMVYKQEALIPAKPIAVDIILPHSWDYICEAKQAFTEELVTMVTA